MTAFYFLNYALIVVAAVLAQVVYTGLYKGCFHLRTCRKSLLD